MTGASPPRRPRLAAIGHALTGGDRAIGLLMIAVVAWYVLTRGIYQGKASGDGFFGFMYLPGLVYFHTFDIAPNVPFWIPYLGHEKTGHVANACPVGPIVFWFPPYLLGLGLQAVGLPLLAQLAHVPVLRPLLALAMGPKPPPLPGQTPFDFWMAGLGSLAAGIAGIGLLFRVLRRKLGVEAARAGVIGGVLATPIVFYLVTQPLYQHATAFFCVMLLIERWDTYRSRGEIGVAQLALLGALGGFAMDMRIQEAIFLLLPGFDALAQLVRALRERRFADGARHVAGGVALGLAALLAFAPQLLLWHWYFAALRTPQPPGHMRWFDPAIVATLFGTRGGVFPWMPIFYFVIPGLFLGRRPLGGLAWRLAVLFCIELWVNASAWDHWGSWSFGPRRFTDATITFAAGIGGLYHAAARSAVPRARARLTRLVVALIAAFAGYNVLLAELVRMPGRLKSSGAGAFVASQWVAWAKGPAWLGRILDRTGYPFVQPAGWIYAAVYHVPVNTFEGVVGNYLLERDCRIHGVTNVHGLSFVEPGFSVYVPEGIAGPPEPRAKRTPVAEHVRILVPMFAVEPLAVSLVGDFGGRDHLVRVQWNGVPLATKATTGAIRFEVPGAIVTSRSRTNQLVLDVPPGSYLARMDVESTTSWWR